MTKIFYCTCEHAYQDATYGKGRRVCNQMKRSINVQHKCTVCGAIKTS